MDGIAIGRKLKELRGKRSSAKVAQDLGISTSALYMYESGERIPRDDVKIRISDYYGVPIQELFYFAESAHR